MAPLGYFFIAIGTVLDSLLGIFIFLLIARAILSWVNPDPSNMIVQFINGSTEPILSRIRAKIPPLGMFDLSVIILLLACYFLRIFLVNSILYYGHQFLPLDAGVVG